MPVPTDRIIVQSRTDIPVCPFFTPGDRQECLSYLSNPGDLLPKEFAYARKSLERVSISCFLLVRLPGQPE